jgi:hypothetical protein
MSPSFRAEPVEEGFFDEAPLRLAATFDIPRTAAQIWADLTTDNPLRWCRILTRIDWTSPRPLGVGATRTARSLGGTTVIDELFFRWEEGRRQSFHVVTANTPMFRRFAEDYLVEATGETSCRFTWVIAIEPRAAFRIANPVNKALLETLFTDTRRHYGLI